MNQKRKNKACTNYKPLDDGMTSAFTIKATGVNCKECVYFSSRNCGVDLSKGLLLETAVL